MFTAVCLCILSLLYLSTEAEDIEIDLKFSLVLNYTEPPINDSCYQLKVPNEGVLIKALIDNTTVVPLHFYYVHGTEVYTANNNKNILKVSSINSSFLNLTYNDATTYIVPFTTSSAVGPYLYNITINNDLLLNQRVRFAWNQTYRAPRTNCDVWALDNISISLQHNGCYRQIYQQDFNNEELPGWDLVNSNISFNSNECDSSNGCLYFISDPDYEGIPSPPKNRTIGSRQATSPMLDLQVITPVTLSSSPTTYKENICNNNDNIIIISFLLQLTQFIGPSPCTDTSPNVILLSLHTEDTSSPLAYFVPVGNKYWSYFNGSSLYNVPIYSPSSSQNSLITTCLNNNISEFSLSWIQENYTINKDIWSLSQVNITLEQYELCYKNESWSLYNGNISHSLYTNKSTLMFDNGNGSLPRSANLSLSYHCDINCSTDGIWPETLPGHNVTGFYCYKGTVNGTRLCKQDGNWDDSIYCFTSKQFNTILSKINSSAITALKILSENNEDITVDQTIFLLSTIINNQLIQSSEPVSINFTKNFNNVINNILTNKTIPNNKDKRRSIGSQLLLTLDLFALYLYNTTGLQMIGDTIAFTVKEITTVTGPIEAISVNNNSITLPPDIFDNLPVKIASFYYKNLSRWLLPDDPNQSIISPVLSSTNCTDCSITDLTTPVNILFNLSSQQISSSDNISCVYWQFKLSDIRLPSGEWSTNGCSLISQEGSTVRCQCDHLTHFAILLSPGVPVSDKDRKILQTIGVVLLPISMICMLLTILTYLCMRSLWSMRNYIHVMLCSNLLIGQLLFVVGIEQTKYWYVCSSIAVVLQYMFLVTFMWMLMEGVVLYVALVRVFIKHPKRYIMCFTLLSYGIPGVYMLIIVPIGYLVGTDENHSHYLLYENDKLVACWLNYESRFIWSFIIPVILILLVNIGFFIMSIVIMRRHQKTQLNKTKVDNIKYWLKSSISLTIVMGIGWLANVLFFTDKLLFISYIMTVFIAGQGIIIFILYVPLSKHVREAYSRWWTNQQNNYQFLSKLSFSKSLTSVSGKNGVRSVPTGNIYGQYTLGTFDESTADILEKKIEEFIPDNTTKNNDIENIEYSLVLKNEGKVVVSKAEVTFSECYYTKY